MNTTHPISTHEFVKIQEANKDTYDNVFKKYQDVLDHVQFLETPAHIDQFIGDNAIFDGWYVWSEDNECIIIRNANVYEDLFWMVEKKHFETEKNNNLTKLLHLCSLTKY